MYPVDGIRSQLEWNSTLNVSDAPVPTESTKYFRKVSLSTRSSSVLVVDTIRLDLYHCNDWWV